jgi:hypothetical protein
LLGAALVGPGCGERFRVPDPAEPPRITSLDGLPGESCGTPLMVVVTDAEGARFCIDRFESALDDGALGHAAQGVSDADPSLDGSTTAKAVVALGVLPRAGLSWYQAKAACLNAGKRLCTLEEWERACRGTLALLYPYGDAVDDVACNGFFNYPAPKPAHTGAMPACGSAYGVYDLSGNLEEWTDSAVARIPGGAILDDRAIRGGGFRANARALSCVGDEFHAAPATSGDDRGFRCCGSPP